MLAAVSKVHKQVALEMFCPYNRSMAMGTRKMRERQPDLWYGGELPTAPGHPFYTGLNEVLDKAQFDSFCETTCARFYHQKLGRPSLPPGQYFRIMMIGFFEGLDSERASLGAWLIRSRSGSSSPSPSMRRRRITSLSRAPGD